MHNRPASITCSNRGFVRLLHSSWFPPQIKGTPSGCCTAADKHLSCAAGLPLAHSHTLPYQTAVTQLIAPSPYRPVSGPAFADSAHSCVHSLKQYPLVLNVSLNTVGSLRSAKGPRPGAPPAASSTTC